MYKPACLLLTILALANTPAFAYRIADTEIPDTVQLVDTNTSLVLNGAGIREKFFVDIYIGALYLPEKNGDAAAILNATAPASMLMHFLYGEISRDKITDGWQDGLEANTSASEMQALQPALDKFNSLFLTAHEGDDVRIDYQPGNGTAVRINGEWRGTVDDDAFFRALLRVWLGPHPVSNDLKAGLLGVD